MQNPTQELTLAINVFLTGVSMPESCDVQVRRNPLRGNRAVNAACASVRLVVVHWLEFVLRPTEDGVEETTGSTRLRDSLTHRKRGGVLFQCSCLSNVELGPVSLEAVAEVEPVTDSVTEVNAEVWNESRSVSAHWCGRFGVSARDGPIFDKSLQLQPHHPLHNTSMTINGTIASAPST